MRAFGARGCVDQATLKRTNAFLAQCRKDSDLKRRENIAALSDRDIQIIMADAIVDAVTKRGCVVAADFKNVGLPDHRIDKNKDAAMRLARRKQPRLDAMLNAGGAI